MNAWFEKNRTFLLCLAAMFCLTYLMSKGTVTWQDIIGISGPVGAYVLRAIGRDKYAAPVNNGSDPR